MYAVPKKTGLQSAMIHTVVLVAFVSSSVEVESICVAIAQLRTLCFYVISCGIKLPRLTEAICLFDSNRFRMKIIHRMLHP